jgi:hypothetical protein
VNPTSRPSYEDGEELVVAVEFKMLGTGWNDDKVAEFKSDPKYYMPFKKTVANVTGAYVGDVNITDARVYLEPVDFGGRRRRLAFGDEIGLEVDFEIMVVVEALLGPAGTFDQAITSITTSLATATAPDGSGNTPFDTALVTEATAMGSSNAISLFTATTSIPPAPIEVLAVSTDVPSSAPTGQPSSEPSTMPTNAPTSLDKENLDPLLDFIMPLSVLAFMSLMGFAYWFYKRATRARKHVGREEAAGLDIEAKLTRRDRRRQTKRGWVAKDATDGTDTGGNQLYAADGTNTGGNQLYAADGTNTGGNQL